MSAWLLLSLGLAAAIIVFAVVFVIARHLDNYGIVDVAWALGFAPLAISYALLADGTPQRRMLIAGMGALWSLRLGGYLAKRVLGHLDREDGRYQQLRRDWGAQLGPKMFRFFQFQALLLALLSTPFALSAANPAPQIHALEWSGLVLWIVALAGETIADAQLATFKRDPANRGHVCDVGLWGWSRHPNYFFEWLIWVAFALFALASPWGWLALGCPVLMLFFLLKVTGVRYTEEQLLRSKGDAYREYQERTSAFLPLPPRRGDRGTS